MVIRGRAPLRVSFGGGGTDVEPFCVEQGGAIIGSTINKYAYCSIIPRDDDQITVHSLDFDMTVKYNAKENYVCDGRLDLVTAALRAMDIKQGCEVYLQCDAPAGSGLGTSSTVMVSLLTAMARWKGITLDNYAMADLAYGVERIDLGISGGYQDQYAATFGGFNFIEFHGRNNVVVNPLRIRRDIINELQYNLLLCYTGNVHIGGLFGDNYTVVTACYWKNNQEQGFDRNQHSTAPEATKVDDSVVTWQKAVDVMNTALQNAGSEWRYELNGALPTLRKQ